MQRLSRELEINFQTFQQKFGSSADFYAKKISIADVSCAVFMFDGIGSNEKLWEMFLSRLSVHMPWHLSGQALYRLILQQSDLAAEPESAADEETLVAKLTSGMAALLINGCDRAILLSVQSMKHRSVGEPSGEGNVRGSQEGFTELLRVNMGLLRRLIRTSELVIEVNTCGISTNTEYAVCYHKGLVSQKLLQKVRRRLDAVSLPFLFDSSYFSPFLQGKPHRLFQPLGYTERPTVACAKICEGKIVILANGSPFALICPFLFAENFESLDDYAFPAYYAGITRVIRYLAFLCAVLLPGMYVMAVSFTPEILPEFFLKSLLKSESETPFSALFQMLGAILVLELIRIADLRMPKSAGHSVSLVAALVVGDTAVKAGLLATSLMICVAVSALAMYSLPKLYEQISLLRLLFLFAGGLFGPAGLAAGIFFLISSVAHNDLIGIGYLQPLWPPSQNTLRDGLIRQPWYKLNNHYFSVSELQRRYPYDKQ